jgi:hypothetical protein
MLDKFKKFFKEEEVVEMTTKKEKPEMASNQEAEAALSALQASFDEQGVALKAALSQIEEMKTAMEEFAEAKAVAEQATKDVIAKAHNEKVEARMSQLTTEFGDEKAAKFAKFADTMEDAEFAEVFGIQKELAVKEEKSFVEQGIEGQVKADKKPTHFKNYIKKQGK